MDKRTLYFAVAMIAPIVAGCSTSSSSNLGNMDRAQQEQAFKADPSKMPPSVQAMVEQQRQHPPAPVKATTP